MFSGRVALEEDYSHGYREQM